MSSVSFRVLDPGGGPGGMGGGPDGVGSPAAHTFFFCIAHEVTFVIQSVTNLPNTHIKVIKLNICRSTQDNIHIAKCQQLCNNAVSHYHSIYHATKVLRLNLNWLDEWYSSRFFSSIQVNSSI